MKKKLGVIGGLGPMATAYFLQLLTQMNDAKTDQEHIECFIYSKPSIPDRTGYIIGKSEENPLPELIKAGKVVKDCGADVLAIPCITAHYFHAQLEKEIGLPLMNAVRNTVMYLKDRQIEKVGIMATDGTVKSELFQKAFAMENMECIVPDDENQRYVMDIIYNNVKAGVPIDIELFYKASDYLFDRGAQVVLLACTELSIMKRDNSLPTGYLDVMEVLASIAVENCGMLKKEYKELIT